jgi:DNA-binding response OmpR family regulator
VLVIDDEDAARRAVAEGLRELGWEVLEAGDGLSGLEAAIQGRPDVVLLDLLLPGLEGEEVLRRLRQTSRVPVIVISAKREEDDRVAALDMGADDYLVKPFTVRELAARIRDVVVDFPSHTASQAGARVPLTAQEFAVLSCLVRNRGRLVTRAMLEALLHPGENPPADAISNVIDVIVLRLRKKLGHDLITTRRGQGFIIDG